MKVRNSVLLLLLGCSASEAPSAQKEEGMRQRVPLMDLAQEAAPAPAATAPGEGGGADGILAPMKSSAPRRGQNELEADEKKKGGRDAPAEPEAPATRAWFPETFLFEPLVVTDANGVATVDARVPDRLTTWRVLGLAHSRDGGMAGAVTSFLGTLPVYVDPILPPTLMAGDQVTLPVQVVNTTAEDRSAKLTVSVSGAASGAGGGVVRIPAYGSVVVDVPVIARGAGTAKLSATLEGADALLRTLEVLPSGRLLESTRTGTLAAPRSVTLSGPAGLDASARVRLVVYPGALALLRAELADALSRGGASEDAYALLLAGQGPTLLRALGEEPDARASREASLLAGQRALRHTLSPDLGQAALFAEAALAHPDNPVMVRLSERLLETLAQQQRPDGTFGGETGWTVQRLLMSTAEAAAAVKAGADRGPAARQRASRVALRASSAFERLAPQVQDPCTAAAVLVSGAAPSGLATKLRETVREAVVTREDGSRALPAPEDIVRADGLRPSELECTALAALALRDDKEAPWLADLGATILGAYHPGWGWGDGRADLVALRAALALFEDPIPDGVRLRLLMDGQPVLEGSLDGDRRKEVVVLEAPAGAAAGEHTWTIEASPAVPGLGYQLSLRSWVPWTGAVGPGGATLDVLPPEGLVRGQAAELLVRTLAPAGMALSAEIRLPAGVVADEEALRDLVTEGRLTRWDAEDGLLRLQIPALGPGQASDLRLRVIPTLSGALQTGVCSLRSGQGPEGQALVSLAPVTWRIR